MDQIDIFSNLASRPVTPSGVRKPNFGTSRQSVEPPPPPPKTITLVEWESSAPLDEEELASITLLRNACGFRPYPANLLENFDAPGPSYSRPATPLNPHRQPPKTLLQAVLSTSSPKSPSTPPLSRSNSPSLGKTGTTPSISSLISTPQQFHEHFSHLTSSLSHSQDALYRAHLAEISGYTDACRELDMELEEVERLVDNMLGCLKWVEERGESLRIAGEDLMQKEARLNVQTQNISSRLAYFTFLEQAQRMLNNPGEDLVLSDGFLDMVERVDECLSYLQSHTDFKDAEIYIIRYQQCMTRSMMLIKMYIVNSVRLLAAEVSKRVNDRQLTRSETATLALLYTKFTSLAFPTRPLVAELELRATQNPDELGSLLSECHTTWISVRKSLIGSRVEREIKAMEPGGAGTDLVDLTRGGCGYLKMTCVDEFNLFTQFFETGEPLIYRFLEGLCDHLYDHLRPRILHETSLTSLCEVCTVLQGLMVEDIDLEYETPAESVQYKGQPPDSYFPTIPPSPIPGLQSRRSFDIDQEEQYSRLPKLKVAQLLQPVLRDAQTRLMARAHAVIKTEVDNYIAKGDDLDYPGKIKRAPTLLRSNHKRSTMVDLDDDNDETPEFFDLPSKDTQDTWYPTLRSTLWVLSCLHNYIETDIFEDIAHEAIDHCRQSLITASKALTTKRGATTVDGQLFLVRHLLILKEMTASVDLVRRYRAALPSRGVVETLSALLASALRMVGVGALVGLVGGSSTAEHMIDAKADVDRQLKSVCEDMITGSADAATALVRSFVERAGPYLSSRTLSQQDWASGQQVLQIHNDFRKQLEETCSTWIQALKLYLQDEATVRVLIPPLQNDIMDRFRPFYDVVTSEYPSDIASSIMGPPALLAALKRIENEALS